MVFAGALTDLFEESLLSLRLDPVVCIQPGPCGDPEACLLESLLDRDEESGVDLSGTCTALDRMAGAVSIERQFSCTLKRKLTVLFQQDRAFRKAAAKHFKMFVFILLHIYC